MSQDGAERRPRFDPSPAQQDRLAEHFFAAAQEGDLPALEALLAEDVVLDGDGGGKAPSLARAVHGHNRVARTVSAWLRQATRITGASVRRTEINGQPGGLVLDRDGNLITALVLEIAGRRIVSVSSIINPDKLRHLGPVADLHALAQGVASGQRSRPFGSEVHAAVTTAGDSDFKVRRAAAEARWKSQR